LETARKDSKSLGTKLTIENEGKEVLKILTEFAKTYKSSIDGSLRHLNISHVPGSVSIVRVFEQQLANELNALNPIENLTQEDILIAIRASGNLEAKFILPEAAYKDLVKTQIKRLETPAVTCAMYIDIEMKKIIENCVSKLEFEMMRFPRLKTAIVTLIEDMLSQRLLVVQEMLKTYVQVEASYVATNKKEFNAEEEQSLNNMDVVGARFSFGQTDGNTAVGQSGAPLNKKQEKLCQIVRNLMTHYFQIIREMLQDHVPKAIMYTVVYFVADNILNELIVNLYNDKENVSRLLAESDDIHEHRQRTEGLIQALERASEVIAEVNHSSI